MESMTLPTSVVIDLDNTLYDYLSCHELALDRAISFLKEELNVTESIIRESLELSRQLIKTSVGLVASSHSRILYAQQLLLLLGFGSKPALALQFEQIYWARFFEEMKPFDGAVDFLTILRFKQIPIVLLTDLTSQIQIRKLIYLGWENLFDFVITSELVGSEKSSERPFIYALDLLRDSEKLNVWFIGDQIFDVPDVDSLKSRALIKDGFGYLKGRNDHNRSFVERFDNFRDFDKFLSV